jgi:hypothetical protein
MCNVHYIVRDVTYLIRPYMDKNWKTCNALDVDKHIYDYNMNLGRSIIKNAFEKQVYV